MTVVPYAPEPNHGPDVVDGWVRTVADVAKLADYISNTDFVPGSYRGQPAAVAAAILAGREIGIGPMTALQHLHVIDGRPAMSAQLMRALVLAAGHSIRVAESTMTRCVLVGARRGGVEQSVTWTMDDAKRANVAGRPSWSRYPRQMLLARATGELCRAIFPDVLGGMGYTHEEAAEIDAPPDVPAIEPATPTKTVRRARTPKTPAPGAVQAPPTPAGPDVPGDMSVPPDAPDTHNTARGGNARPSQPSPAPVSSPFAGAGEPPAWQHSHPVTADGEVLLSPEQRGAIMAAMTEWGRMEPRSLRLRTLSGLIGRELVSASQLTRTEASQVLDTLANLRTMPNPDEALSVLVTAGWDHIDNGQAVLPIE